MNLTKRQRDDLTQHIDRADGVPVTRERGLRMVRGLIASGLLRGDQQGRPRHTFLTDHGSEEMCRALGAIADGISVKQFMKRNGNWTQQRQAGNGQWQTKGRRRLRNRALYMRDYKRRRRQDEPDFQERING